MPTAKSTPTYTNIPCLEKADALLATRRLNLNQGLGPTRARPVLQVPLSRAMGFAVEKLPGPWHWLFLTRGQ